MDAENPRDLCSAPPGWWAVFGADDGEVYVRVALWGVVDDMADYGEPAVVGFVGPEYIAPAEGSHNFIRYEYDPEREEEWRG